MAGCGGGCSLHTWAYLCVNQGIVAGPTEYSHSPARVTRQWRGRVVVFSGNISWSSASRLWVASATICACLIQPLVVFPELETPAPLALKISVYTQCAGGQQEQSCGWYRWLGSFFVEKLPSWLISVFFRNISFYIWIDLLCFYLIFIYAHTRSF